MTLFTFHNQHSKDMSKAHVLQENRLVFENKPTSPTAENQDDDDEKAAEKARKKSEEDAKLTDAQKKGKAEREKKDLSMAESIYGPEYGLCIDLGGEAKEFAEACWRMHLPKEVIKPAYESIFKGQKEKIQTAGENPYKELLKRIKEGKFKAGDSFKTALYKEFIDGLNAGGEQREAGAEILKRMHGDITDDQEIQYGQKLKEARVKDAVRSGDEHVRDLDGETREAYETIQNKTKKTVESAEAAGERDFRNLKSLKIPKRAEKLLPLLEKTAREANEQDERVKDLEKRIEGVKDQKHLKDLQKEFERESAKLIKLWEEHNRVSAKVNKLAGNDMEIQRQREEALDQLSRAWGVPDLKTLDKLVLPLNEAGIDGHPRTVTIHFPPHACEFVRDPEKIHFEDDPGYLLIHYYFEGSSQVHRADPHDFYQRVILDHEAYQEMEDDELKENLGFEVKEGMEFFHVVPDDKNPDKFVSENFKIQSIFKSKTGETVIEVNNPARKDGKVQAVSVNALADTTDEKDYHDRLHKYFSPGQLYNLLIRQRYTVNADRKKLVVPEPGQSVSFRYHGEFAHLECFKGGTGWPYLTLNVPATGETRSFNRPIRKQDPGDPNVNNSPEIIDVADIDELKKVPTIAGKSRPAGPALETGSTPVSLESLPHIITEEKKTLMAKLFGGNKSRVVNPAIPAALYDFSTGEKKSGGLVPPTKLADVIDINRKRGPDYSAMNFDKSALLRDAATHGGAVTDETEEETPDAANMQGHGGKVAGEEPHRTPPSGITEASAPYADEIEALPWDKAIKTGGMPRPEEGLLKKIWRQTTFMSLNDIWAMGKTMYEFHDRRFQRNQQARFSTAAQHVKYFAPEMKRIKQQSENERVHQFKEAMEHFGVWEIEERLHVTKDKDELKACIETLVEKGELRFDDIEMWGSINRFSDGKYYIPIPADGDPSRMVSEKDKRTGVSFLEKAMDSIWGENTFGEWFPKNKSAFKSNVDKYYEKGDELEGVEGGHQRRLEELLTKHKRGEYVNPHEYESLILHAIERGKSSGENKFYYMVEGVAAKNPHGHTILAFDRIAHINSRMMTQFPFLQYMCGSPMREKEGKGTQHKFTRSDYEQWQQYFDGGDPLNAKPNKKVIDFLWRYVIPSHDNRERSNKGLRNADKMDHDDMHMILPIVSTQVITDACKSQGGGGKEMITKEGYMNGFVGFSMAFKTFAEQNKRTRLKESIQSYVRFESIMMKKYKRGREGFARLDPTLLDKTCVVSEFTPLMLISRLNPMVKQTLEAYAVNPQTTDSERQRIYRFVELNSRTNNDWTLLSAQQEKTDNEELTRYLDNFDEFFSHLVSKDNGQTMMDIANAADLVKVEYRDDVTRAKRKAQMTKLQSELGLGTAAAGGGVD